ncbi:hypothetical protein MJG53_008274 [Ovis ammon polii x Ovis aries]|uniref:Uncharacterized protein n=1 Tax=Ovis ammon polii x Ovis aries TaxID=2918886 RepID=A0ACB9V004_9CETA|nr:hypothetical protein MJG53_008274 [Ovis ammon polii x Ovis aries]
MLQERAGSFSSILKTYGTFLFTGSSLLPFADPTNSNTLLIYSVYPHPSVPNSMEHSLISAFTDLSSFESLLFTLKPEISVYLTTYAYRHSNMYTIIEAAPDPSPQAGGSHATSKLLFSPPSAVLEQLHMKDDNGLTWNLALKASYVNLNQEKVELSVYWHSEKKLVDCLAFLLCIDNFWYLQLECSLLEWIFLSYLHVNNMIMTL